MEEQQLEQAAGSSGSSIVTLVIYAAIAVVYIVGMYKTFEKAGQPGWAAIIPIYNLYVLTQVAGKPAWWILLILCTGVIGMVLIGIAVAERFGKSTVFGVVALGIFPMVGYAMIGFGDATYSASPAA